MPKTHFRSKEPPSIEEAQKIIGGYVQLVPLPDGTQMLVDEDGLAKELPLNVSASERAASAGYFPHIVGDVLILTGPARWAL